MVIQNSSELQGPLWAVTSYYNPARYQTKLQNFQIFAAALSASGVPLLTVECAFGDDPFTLSGHVAVVQVRARDVMWQKERLLNVAIAQLPPSCSQIAWLDADILFENADWARETSALLATRPVVQPFETVVRLPRGHELYQGEGESWEGFAAAIARDPDSVLGGDFTRHGHTGFVWAARREILERHGLYDACISGSGDHMIAHGFAGDWESPCLDRILGNNSAHRAHFAAWAKRVYPDVRARVGYVPGRILHLWHGDHVNRRYVLRNQELSAFQFDPERDIKIGRDGAWEWSSDRSDLRQWAIDYYRGRKEDG
jgi:hypothetical protein